MAVIRDRKDHLWYTCTFMQRIIGTTDPCGPMDSMSFSISRYFLFFTANLIRGSPYLMSDSRL